MNVKIVAVSGSLQAKSANRTLLDAAMAAVPEGVTMERFDGLGALPHFNPDLEAAGPIAAVAAWRAALAGSDAVLIASPEYGHSLPGVLKNGIDWVIGSGELERKIVAITAAVPHPDRGRKGLAALADTLRAVRATIVGGEPIARGPEAEARITALVAELIAAVRADAQVE